MSDDFTYSYVANAGRKCFVTIHAVGIGSQAVYTALRVGKIKIGDDERHESGHYFRGEGKLQKAIRYAREHLRVTGPFVRLPYAPMDDLRKLFNVDGFVSMEGLEVHDEG